METLSSSLSTQRLARLPSITEDHHLLRPPTSHTTPQTHLFCKPNLLLSLPSQPNLSKGKTSLTKSKHLPFLSSSPTPPLKRATNSHHTAASGYAAALFDVARCHNDIDAVEKDAERLSKLLRNGGIEGEGDMKEVKLHKRLVTLVKMLVKRGKVGMIGEVLEEFKRLCDEVRGTCLVLVSSEKKMKEEELLRVARRVQAMSGAVAVKLRHVFAEGFSKPSFA